MLNEFSRQADLQVLFDFNMRNGMKMAALNGDFDTSTRLKTMSDGTSLVFEFVNDPTLGASGVVSRHA